ncbi:TlyA family rRNA (cytidine-2'-O)-methyltransferase [Candidatus Peregrinibacteria bacterium]|nr:TlyA family rRNA (cytidine-2'-O)-methyltransferase [Candidatus Peregrinibacteria bacterium]
MRLDIFLVKNGFVKSRERAKDLISKKHVSVDGIIISKCSHNVSDNSEINLKSLDIPFVSRAGLKLQKALESFKVIVKDKICLDIGVATGGFTDCLLQNGASKVIAIDVGDGQLDKKLVSDSRVEFLAHTDARNFKLNRKIDLVVIDISFISITKIIDNLKHNIQNETDIIALIKPQFEYDKKHHGIISDSEVRNQLVEKVKKEFIERGFILKNQVESPILGKGGNKEILFLLKLELNTSPNQ